MASPSKEGAACGLGLCSAAAFLALGGAYGCSQWPDSPVAWYSWLGLAPAFWAGLRLPPREALCAGWLFGSAGWAAGTYWMPGTIALFMHASALTAAALFACMAASHGFMCALLGAGLALPVSEEGGGSSRWRGWLAGTALFTALEGYYPELFPWRIAASQLDHPALLGGVAACGTAALAWPMAATNAAVAGAASSPRSVRSWAPLALSTGAAAALAWCGGVWLGRLDAALPARPSLRLLLVQSDAPPALARESERVAGDLAEYAAMTRAALGRARPDLVLWPEGVYPRRVELAALPFTADGRPLDDVLREDLPPGPPLLFNALTERVALQGVAVRVNTALLVDAGRRLASFADKRYLMPFGEFMPFARVFPSLRRLSPGTWRLGSGRGLPIVALPAGPRLGVLICYEDLLRRRAEEAAGAGAQLLVSMSNGAWFSPAAREAQLHASRLRAVETGRFLVRASNGGVSAVVDPAGRVTARLDSGRRGTLDVRVGLYSGPPASRAAGRALYAAALLVWLALAGPAAARRWALHDA